MDRASGNQGDVDMAENIEAAGPSATKPPASQTAALHTPITDVPLSVLGVAAHPDDLDFMASGTMAAWAAGGAEIYYLILTMGDKGSADRDADPRQLTDLRRQEQRDAAKILGLKDVFFCDYEDGLLAPSFEVKRDIVRIIRKLQPEAVVTVDPLMLYNVERSFINHADHRAAGQATIDAVFPLARDHLSFPEIYGQEHLEPHKVKTLYLTHFGQENCFVDITATMDLKLQAIAAHDSQIPDLPATEKLMRDYARQAGCQAGVEYAEGFIRINIR